VDAFGLVRGGPERPPDDRRRAFLAAGNGGSPMSLCCRHRFTRTHQRHRICSGRLGLDDTGPVCNRSTVDPWTRSTATRQRVHRLVVHRANHMRPRGAQSAATGQLTVSRVQFSEKPLGFQ